jgi:hypothetical protein
VIGLRKRILYIDDALFSGGNDYPAEEAGIVCIAVNGPDDTNLIIKTMSSKQFLLFLATLESLLTSTNRNQEYAHDTKNDEGCSAARLWGR